MGKRLLAALLPLLVFANSAGAQDGQATADQPLARADFIQQMDAEFKRYDGDGSGTVVPEEVAAAQRSAAQTEALRRNGEVFQSLDRDGSGTLGPDEFAALVDTTDVQADPDPLMAQFDTDRDGVVTLVEYRIVTQANFDRIDTDRDGIVSPAEMRAANIIR